MDLSLIEYNIINLTSILNELSPSKVGPYCVIPNVIKSSVNDSNRITLVLHGSYDRIHSTIEQHVLNWKGPVSLSVIFPKFSNLQNDHVYCAIQWYPINFARNFARKQVKTKFILIADLDHTFSENFELKMRNLAIKALPEGSKRVLVYRIFEIDRGIPWPKSKKELKAFLNVGRAIEFHSRYSNAHQIPNLKTWLDEEDHGNTTTIQFSHPYDSYAWEPQFVARNDIPFHDESFPYSARDNTVLRWELCRAGYEFSIVHDVFMFHPGIKTMKYKQKLDFARKRTNKVSNDAIYNFRLRMNETYPGTAATCPEFQQ
ncbi:hypothetical protein FO519_008400 [Halicephalobus sp. NKZ332]|nr:hypothetical protein FO519_008400 [Halicephalobus sp. NKZ332]